MKILWFTWKDRKNPASGGAEIVNEELAKRLVADGHEVVFLVGGFEGSVPKENKDGFKIIRVGGKWSVYLEAYTYYKKNLSNWPDLVIDEVNTVPFFSKLYVKQKNILFIHQLCREIWFYQIFFPLNLIGYILEPVYLWLLNDKKVITVSESTKKNLIKYGFKKENISIISEGIELMPVEDFETISKFEKPTILSLGTIRSMKRTGQILKAFEILKKDIPEARLIIAGRKEGVYGDRFVNDVEKSMYKSSIKCIGSVSMEEKIELFQKSHVLVVTSVKEGWGLVVTEANSQGTPSVVYDVDGLRDAVRNGETGLVCSKNTPEDIAKKMVQILHDKEEYKTLQKNAWEWSKQINFENSYKQFIVKINE
jgi:glycosyltransferase involved in cell wall biosynthesis